MLGNDEPLLETFSTKMTIKFGLNINFGII